MRSMYVVTYHKFNHEGPSRKPIDARFLETTNPYSYYLIDKTCPDILKEKPVLFEHAIDEDIYQAGGTHFGEWSFLLAEEKHAFASYPFFMISSRFYEKNSWLYRSLDEEWDTLFAYLEKYGWGYLPSYDRPLHWVDLSWKKQMKKKPSKHRFWPFHEEAFHLMEDLFGIKTPEDYHYTPFLFCNYIGFASRQHLLDYVSYYKPLLSYFFDDSYTLKRSLDPYVKTTGHFRNEKPFTFLLELYSHQFFYAAQQKYMALHYDGYYEIDERNKKMRRLEAFNLPAKTSLRRWLGWQKHTLLQKVRDVCNL